MRTEKTQFDKGEMVRSLASSRDENLSNLVSVVVCGHRLRIPDCVKVGACSRYLVIRGY